MSEHFLVVDDDADSAFLARRNLMSAFPHAVIDHAETGEAALNAIVREEFDVIITDYRMPWMDGLTLVRRIRQSNMRVVIIMRTAMEGLDDQARAAGVDCVLPWYRWRDLGDFVREVLHCHAGGGKTGT